VNRKHLTATASTLLGTAAPLPGPALGTQTGTTVVQPAGNTDPLPPDRHSRTDIRVPPHTTPDEATR